MFKNQICAAIYIQLTLGRPRLVDRTVPISNATHWRRLDDGVRVIIVVGRLHGAARAVQDAVHLGLGRGARGRRVVRRRGARRALRGRGASWGRQYYMQHFLAKPLSCVK